MKGQDGLKLRYVCEFTLLSRDYIQQKSKVFLAKKVEAMRKNVIIFPFSKYGYSSSKRHFGTMKTTLKKMSLDTSINYRIILLFILFINKIQNLAYLFMVNRYKYSKTFYLGLSSYDLYNMNETLVWFNDRQKIEFLTFLHETSWNNYDICVFSYF